MDIKTICILVLVSASAIGIFSILDTNSVNNLLKQSKIQGQINDSDIQNGDGPVYNITQSQLYATFSALAYCPEKCLQDWKCGLSRDINFTEQNYLYNSVSQLAGFMGYMPETKTIIVSWRGTVNKRNWWEDDNFQMLPYARCGNCKVHSGFYFDYILSVGAVKKQIDLIKSKHAVQKIVTTGHSLGAAIASLMGLDLKLHYHPQIKQVEIHNFGQPRVGNMDFAHFMRTKVSNKIFRVVHSHDCVPHMPNVTYGYVHSPHEIFFDDADMQKYTICNESGQDKKCSNQYFPDVSWDDHGFYFLKMNHVAANC